MSFINRVWKTQQRLEERFRRIGRGQYGRVLRLARKPTSEEFVKSSWVVGIGIAIVGFIGFVDDFLKIRRGSSKGLSSRLKIIAQVLFSLMATFMITDLMEPGAKNNLSIPFIKDVMVHLGWFFFPFSILVIVGASNAVNLTDGLDCLLYTSPSPRDATLSRMPSSA